MEVMVIQVDRHASIQTDRGFGSGSGGGSGRGALFKDHAEKTKLTR
jgi:hypothetical protein